ncbi:M13 family metallopeptidase [Prevotella sp. kh1p2]|uniref:M13 family metallopeptidase n=1 Tax=Prevotella sp. kh1p2 TaxID=1761883 RepID=UPI0008D23857|nr:M13 family metallopeptidase [Prevotella sp. kh1p2]SES96482.1 putative endopeptidase [Prevotella sp. kh1p2]SNU11340.1 putative endopeptidase [Prevotellaceae bacterium KH2P17]
MNMKQILPIVMMVAAPTMGVAQQKSGLVMSNLDKTAKPADDFYQFATGGWQKAHPLPAAYSRYGSFDKLQEDNNVRINSILGDLLKKKYKQGTTEQKLSDFYKLAMDSVRRNKEGVSPVKPLLNEMEQAATKADLRRIQLKYAAFGYGVPMGIGFGADEKNAKMNILNIYQGGLTLGEKEYYLDNDEATTAIREAYKEHIARMFHLFGFSDAAASAKRDAVIRFETSVALISKSNTELRDPQANYNKMSLKQFEANYPNIPLESLLNAEGVKSSYFQEMVVGQPQFVAGIDKLTSVLTTDDLKAIMEWDAIMMAAGYLSDDVIAANFDFFGKTMRGRQQDFPRWKRAVNQVEAAMGEPLGKMYCERYFPASSKKRMEQLIRNLQVSLGQRIDAQTWMSDTTKAAAHAKLDAFYVKVGYPNKWKDWSGLTIDPAKSYYENAMAVALFKDKRSIEEKAGKPVDRDEWHMTPQTVNAYYNPTTNEICFPAGILQYPFFDPKADDAFNYGAIGVVIGHEMTHGFDDQGSQYDKDGNMKNWWTASDEANFKKRGDMYADFFSSIEVLPGLHGNGRFTLGENLADHGGLQVSFNAFKNATAKSPLKAKDGFTPEQRFFIAYAGVWGQNITEKEIRNRVKADPHAQGEWRVNGALPHIDAWYEAFDVKSTDKMYLPKEKRLELW